MSDIKVPKSYFLAQIIIVEKLKKNTNWDSHLVMVQAFS